MMTAEEHNAVDRSDAKIRVTVGKKTVELSYEDAFALALSSLEQKHPELAARLFARLTSFEERGPRAWIMKAFCEAAAKNWEHCSETIRHVFPDGPSAQELHEIFVMYHAGFKEQAINDLLRFVKSNPEFPTLYLLLGDMFATKQIWESAQKCWTAAIKHDRRGGTVARVSAARLKRLAKRNAGGTP